MVIGIAGRPQSGKTTLFRILTGSSSSRPGQAADVGVMTVQDWRVDRLAELFRPSRKVYVTFDLMKLGTMRGPDFIDSVRKLDAVIVVLGVFADGSGAEEVADVFDEVRTEFFIADLAAVESRLERISARKAKPVSQMEIPFLEKCRRSLEEEIPLSQVEFEPHERAFLPGYAFLTLKPVVIAANIPESALGSDSFPGKELIEREASRRGYKFVTFCGRVEEEIRSLPPEERENFRKEYGVSGSAIDAVQQAVYSSLGLITFFTTKSNEVRAWSIPRGYTARQAAGKIHSDLERGFIRAEVVSFSDLDRFGSFKACRDRGLVRLEGREYIVKDGDVITVRFAV